MSNSTSDTIFDTILSGGTVIDGSGAPAMRADVGIRAGRIAAIGQPGKLGRSARQVQDVAGLTVTPGFVDPHTHYDAQILWDPRATPSNLHGVTSIIGGNCGFSIAPITPRDTDYVTRMLAKVEGIPLEALQAGLDFGWGSFGEYLGRMEGRLGLNAGFLAGHSTIRRVVMGERAVHARASADDLLRMRALLRASLAEGALGFSSTWHPVHTDGDGNPVPSRAADQDEMVALAGELANHPGTMLEFTPGMYGEWGARETAVMIAMSRAARQPINWNPARVRESDPATLEAQLVHGSAAARQGARIVGLFYPFPNSTEVSLSTARIYETIPGWDALMQLPIPERMRQLADPAVRQRLLEGSTRATGVGRLASNWEEVRFERIAAPGLQHLIGCTAGELGRREGKSAFDAYLDLAIADALRTYVSYPVDAVDERSYALRVQALRDPRAILGGTDAGAHVDSICNANLSSRLIAEFVRGRQLLGLEEAIRMLTDAPARFYGLVERGRIQEGWHADLCVFDAATVGAGPLVVRNDFPAGAPRLYSAATGVCHVFVNGTAVVRDGVATGALPGTVLRSGRATAGQLA